MSQVLGPGYQLVEKISTEVAAGRLQADVYQCGGQSGRTVAWRGLSEEFIPPDGPRSQREVAVADDEQGDPPGRRLRERERAATSTRSWSRPEKYPKSYWDLVRDPYWVDLIKRKRMAFTDPRIANIGVYHMYGLKEVNAKDYGEAWVREFAGLKPKLYGFNESGEVARGELHAMLGGPWRSEYNLGAVSITKICLEPGCVSTQSRCSPWSRARRTRTRPGSSSTSCSRKEYADWRVQALGNTPARADVAPRPARRSRHAQAPVRGDDKAERQITEVLKWVIASKLFDY